MEHSEIVTTVKECEKIVASLIESLERIPVLRFGVEERVTAQVCYERAMDIGLSLLSASGDPQVVDLYKPIVQKLLDAAYSRYYGRDKVESKV